MAREEREHETHWIGSRWQKGSGELIKSNDSATGELIWSGYSAGEQEVEEAVKQADAAFETWGWLPLERRIDYLQRYAAILQERKEAMALTISKENGKPFWEAVIEVGAMINKVSISIQAYQERCLEKIQEGHPHSIVRHRPHGVVVVLGPFNFPGHLPNGHIVPALLAGNCVLFKPSELTPLCGQEMVRCWEAAGLPKGVLQLLQGKRETGILLSSHPDIQGLYLTGSWRTGRYLLEQQAAHPGKILALEMGGNNPLVVSHISNAAAAAYATVLSAYATSGQRCTCARRLIVLEQPSGRAFVKELQQLMKTIHIGVYSDRPEPFMGPLINRAAAQHVLERQAKLLQSGAKALIPVEQLSKTAALLSPGLIDVTGIKEIEDEEIFGPLLQLTWVDSLERGIQEANKTSYGLAAGLFSDSPEEFKLFLRRVRAGVINWNSPTTGASSSAPFGGLGRSGNFRPSAYYAADYCSYPIASHENSLLTLPSKPSPGIFLQQQI